MPQKTNRSCLLRWLSSTGEVNIMLQERNQSNIFGKIWVGSEGWKMALSFLTTCKHARSFGNKTFHVLWTDTWLSQRIFQVYYWRCLHWNNFQSTCICDQNFIKKARLWRLNAVSSEAKSFYISFGVVDQRLWLPMTLSRSLNCLISSFGSKCKPIYVKNIQVEATLCAGVLHCL